MPSACVLCASGHEQSWVVWFSTRTQIQLGSNCLIWRAEAKLRGKQAIHAYGKYTQARERIHSVFSVRVGYGTELLDFHVYAGERKTLCACVRELDARENECLCSNIIIIS